MTSLVTVGIPTYNRADLLAEAVASALAQDHPAVEVVVSDNASTDGTEALCRGLAAQEPRLRYIRQDENIGATANFKAVLAAARGDYFMWLTDDDLVAPNYVSACVAVLEREPEIDLVAGRATLLLPDGRVEQDVDINLLSGDPASRVLDYYRAVGRNSVFFGIVRTRALRDLPEFGNVMGADWFHIAALAFGGKVQTVETARLTRSAGGVSDNLRVAARSLGLGRFARRLPRAALAVAIANDILRSPAYSSLPPSRRRRLAVRSAMAAGWRVGVRFHVVRGVRAAGRHATGQLRKGNTRSRSEIVSSPTAGH